MKKLVIIGGGFAGSYIAKALENKFDTTLIDAKDYFEFTPGILRTIVEPRHLKKIQILHSHYLHKANITIGDVINLTKKEVIIKTKYGKKSIPFDYLAICSGSSYNVPIKEQDLVITARANHLIKYNKKLCKAKKVLIIGGGLVGIELAAEIAAHYDKEITIVHAHNKLIERNTDKARRYTEKFLKKHNVKIIYNEKVVKSKNKTYITDKKRKIKADIAFLCTGIIPNSDFMKHHFSRNIDDKGFIKVNSRLQLENWLNIFVAGDVNNIKIEKTAQNSINQAKMAAKNILATNNNKKLKAYKSKNTSLVISLGKHNGIFTSKYLTVSGIIPALIKRAIEKFEMTKLIHPV